MHVLLSTTAYAAQSYYRIDEPARAVQEAGLGVTVTVRKGLETTMVRRPGSDELVVGDVEDHGADVVVLQLPMTEALLQCTRVLQARGVAVVVELDDLLSAVPAHSTSYTNLVKKGHARHTLACAREADMVTVTTPALLAEYAAHGRGMVIPNTVPRRIAELPPAYERDTGSVVVGWTGSGPARGADLGVVGTGLQQALDRTAGRSRFTVLGQAEGTRAALALREEPAETWWLPEIDDYLAVVGEQFDVGIAPLREDRFNLSKSWLKVLEYAARGVYPVHSPHPQYDLLALGRRARNPRDWARLLTRAVEDDDHRRELAASAHASVLAGMLTEHVAEWWVDAWTRARDNRHQALRRGA